MIDQTAIVYEALTQASTLYTEVGNRIWSPVAPAKGFDGTQSGIVYHIQDGSCHVTGATHDATFTFKCYGGSDNTFTKAREVARLLNDRLQMLSETQTSGTIMMARLVNHNDVELTETDTKYKVHIAQYLIKFEG